MKIAHPQLFVLLLINYVAKKHIIEMRSLRLALAVLLLSGCCAAKRAAVVGGEPRAVRCTPQKPAWRVGADAMAATPSMMVLQRRGGRSLAGRRLPDQGFLWAESYRQPSGTNRLPIVLSEPPADVFVIRDGILLVASGDELMSEVRVSTGETVTAFGSGAYFEIEYTDPEYARGAEVFRQVGLDVVASGGREWESHELLDCGDAGLMLINSATGGVSIVAEDGSAWPKEGVTLPIDDTEWVYADAGRLSAMSYAEGVLHDSSSGRCYAVDAPPKVVEATPTGLAVLSGGFARFFPFEETRPAIVTCRPPDPIPHWVAEEPIPEKAKKN